MTEDLVKRLREGDHFEKVMSAEQAADRIDDLETKLAKAVEALEKLDVGEGWAAQIARATIAELTGGKDD